MAGIGKAVVEALKHAGVRVVVADLQPPKDMNAEHAIFVKCDVTRPEGTSHWSIPIPHGMV